MARVTEVLVTVSESLECDGGSISATTPDGTKLDMRKVAERRQARTAYVTWAITIPDSRWSPGTCSAPELCPPPPTCPTCHGEGFVVRRRNIGGKVRTWSEPCPDCAGPNTDNPTGD